MREVSTFCAALVLHMSIMKTSCNYHFNGCQGARESGVDLMKTGILCLARFHRYVENKYIRKNAWKKFHLDKKMWTKNCRDEKMCGRKKDGRKNARAKKAQTKIYSEEKWSDENMRDEKMRDDKLRDENLWTKKNVTRKNARRKMVLTRTTGVFIFQL